MLSVPKVSQKDTDVIHDSAERMFLLLTSRANCFVFFHRYYIEPHRSLLKNSLVICPALVVASSHSASYSFTLFTHRTFLQS